MNVNDFKTVEVPVSDKLLHIFNYQRDLMEKYHEIEEKNVGHKIPASPIAVRDITMPDLIHREWKYAGPLDINDRASQLRLKDFCWRITEELTEATLAHTDKTHFEEELIDALHFAVELMCLSGIEPTELCFDFVDSSPFSRQDVYDVIEAFGEAANMLKLKPWKTTAMLTDIVEYRKAAIKGFNYLIRLLSVAGFTENSATEMYLRKNAVNKFRQRSNY